MIRYLLLLCFFSISFLEANSYLVYPNNLKSWELGKEAPQNFCPEQVTIAAGQGTSEDENLEVMPTLPKTNSSSCLGINGELIDDDRVAELITVITSTSPIRSNPSLKHIYPSQQSLHLMPALAKCKKIIVFDGVPPNKRVNKKNYVEFIRAVELLTQTDPFFLNTELVICEEWVHLTGTLKEAIKRVTTPFVFIHQHDHYFTKEFDLNGCIATMLSDPSIKYIHFPRCELKNYVNNEYYGECLPFESKKTFVPLSYGFGWADHSHITTVDYYNDFVFPQCGFGFMENFLHPMFKKELKTCKNFNDIMNVHAKYGTFLYDLEQGPYVVHSNGRRN